MGKFLLKSKTLWGELDSGNRYGYPECDRFCCST